ncbi:hypothetical protein OAF54_01130 [bacterium]|nr:hypothetical protein [bacterium]
MEDMKHLWEIDHPYYCAEDHYFGTGRYDSPNDHHHTWASFVNEYQDVDKDYNLIFRWDWELDDEDGKPHEDKYYRDGTLKIFWMIQRKGFHRVTSAKVCQADEPEVIKYLKPFWKHMQELWGGISEPERG